MSHKLKNRVINFCADRRAAGPPSSFLSWGPSNGA
jgi:hypothetical protein